MVTLVNPKNPCDTFSFTVYDSVEKDTIESAKKKYIDEGVDDSVAYSLACRDVEEQRYKPDRKLHEIDDAEKKSIPKWVKDKPIGEGKYYWRAPAFQYFTVPSDIDIFEGYALVLLGNLKPGDILPIKLNPEKFGHSCEYYTFLKYSHKFPTGKYWIHSETLLFEDKEGNNVRFTDMPNKYYTNKNYRLIQDLASVISYWAMCRLENSEEMFGDLFAIIQREHFFHQGYRGNLEYSEDFDSTGLWKEKPCALHAFRENGM